MEDNERDVAALMDTLRRVRPARLVVVSKDGDKREVACATGRAARHAQSARAVLGLGVDIERVDLCDAKGAVLGSWRPEAPEGPETTSLETDRQSDPIELRLAMLVTAAVQKAVDHREDRARLAQKDLLDGFVQLTRGLLEQNATYRREQSATLQLAYEAVKMRASAEVVAQLPADGQSETDGMVMELLKQAMGGAAPPVVDNGKRPKGAA
jgi:hypothetical protein